MLFQIEEGTALYFNVNDYCVFPSSLGKERYPTQMSIPKTKLYTLFRRMWYRLVQYINVSGLVRCFRLLCMHHTHIADESGVLSMNHGTGPRVGRTSPFGSGSGSVGGGLRGAGGGLFGSENVAKSRPVGEGVNAGVPRPNGAVAAPPTTTKPTDCQNHSGVTSHGSSSRSG